MDNNYKAVLVDDDAAVRQFFQDCLSRNNFDLTGYSEAEQLLGEVFHAGFPLESAPDLLLLDLQLQPGKMQGIDLLNELAERDVPTEILAISGNLPNADIVEAIKFGAATGIAKPFENLLSSCEGWRF